MESESPSHVRQLLANSVRRFGNTVRRLTFNSVDCEGDYSFPGGQIVIDAERLKEADDRLAEEILLAWNEELRKVTTEYKDRERKELLAWKEEQIQKISALTRMQSDERERKYREEYDRKVSDLNECIEHRQLELDQLRDEIGNRKKQKELAALHDATNFAVMWERERRVMKSTVEADFAALKEAKRQEVSAEAHCQRIVEDCIMSVEVDQARMNIERWIEVERERRLEVLTNELDLLRRTQITDIEEEGKEARRALAAEVDSLRSEMVKTIHDEMDLERKREQEKLVLSVTRLTELVGSLADDLALTELGKEMGPSTGPKGPLHRTLKDKRLKHVTRSEPVSPAASSKTQRVRTPFANITNRLVGSALKSKEPLVSSPQVNDLLSSGVLCGIDHPSQLGGSTESPGPLASQFGMVMDHVVGFVKAQVKTSVQRAVDSSSLDGPLDTFCTRVDRLKDRINTLDCRQKAKHAVSRSAEQTAAQLAQIEMHSQTLNVWRRSTRLSTSCDSVGDPEVVDRIRLEMKSSVDSARSQLAAIASDVCERILAEMCAVCTSRANIYLDAYREKCSRECRSELQIVQEAAETYRRMAIHSLNSLSRTAMNHFQRHLSTELETVRRTHIGKLRAIGSTAAMRASTMVSAFTIGVRNRVGKVLRSRQVTLNHARVDAWKSEIATPLQRSLNSQCMELVGRIRGQIDTAQCASDRAVSRAMLQLDERRETILRRARCAIVDNEMRELRDSRIRDMEAIVAATDRRVQEEASDESNRIFVKCQANKLLEQLCASRQGMLYAIAAHGDTVRVVSVDRRKAQNTLMQTQRQLQQQAIGKLRSMMFESMRSEAKLQRDSLESYAVDRAVESVTHSMRAVLQQKRNDFCELASVWADRFQSACQQRLLDSMQSMTRKARYAFESSADDIGRMQQQSLAQLRTLHGRLSAAEVAANRLPKRSVVHQPRCVEGATHQIAADPCACPDVHVGATNDVNSLPAARRLDLFLIDQHSNTASRDGHGRGDANTLSSCRTAVDAMGAIIRERTREDGYSYLMAAKRQWHEMLSDHTGRIGERIRTIASSRLQALYSELRKKEMSAEADLAMQKMTTLQQLSAVQMHWTTAAMEVQSVRDVKDTTAGMAMLRTIAADFQSRLTEVLKQASSFAKAEVTFQKDKTISEIVYQRSTLRASAMVKDAAQARRMFLSGIDTHSASVLCTLSEGIVTSHLQGMSSVVSPAMVRLLERLQRVLAQHVVDARSTVAENVTASAISTKHRVVRATGRSCALRALQIHEQGVEDMRDELAVIKSACERSLSETMERYHGTMRPFVQETVMTAMSSVGDSVKGVVLDTNLTERLCSPYIRTARSSSSAITAAVESAISRSRNTVKAAVQDEMKKRISAFQKEMTQRYAETGKKLAAFREQKRGEISAQLLDECRDAVAEECDIIRQEARAALDSDVVFERLRRFEELEDDVSEERIRRIDELDAELLDMEHSQRALALERVHASSSRAFEMLVAHARETMVESLGEMFKKQDMRGVSMTRRLMFFVSNVQDILDKKTWSSETFIPPLEEILSWSGSGNESTDSLSIISESPLTSPCRMQRLSNECTPTRGTVAEHGSPQVPKPGELFLRPQCRLPPVRAGTPVTPHVAFNATKLFTDDAIASLSETSSASGAEPIVEVQTIEVNLPAQNYSVRWKLDAIEKAGTIDPFRDLSSHIDVALNERYIPSVAPLTVCTSSGTEAELDIRFRVLGASLTDACCTCTVYQSGVLVRRVTNALGGCDASVETVHHCIHRVRFDAGGLYVIHLKIANGDDSPHWSYNIVVTADKVPPPSAAYPLQSGGSCQMM